MTKTAEMSEKAKTMSPVTNLQISILTRLCQNHILCLKNNREMAAQ